MCLGGPGGPFKAPKNALFIEAHDIFSRRPPVLAVEIAGLNKTYTSRKGAKTALTDFSLQIPRGSFFGLLGPNSAGKSTMINIMAGLVAKSFRRGEDLELRHRRGRAPCAPRHRGRAAGTEPRPVLHPARTPGSASGSLRRAQE